MEKGGEESKAYRELQDSNGLFVSADVKASAFLSKVDLTNSGIHIII